MGQMAGDLGWREFEARAGGRGVATWLRLGRGWEGLTGVDGGQGLRGNWWAKAKDTGYSRPEDGNEAGMNEGDGLVRCGQRRGQSGCHEWGGGRRVMVWPGLGRGWEALTGLNGERRAASLARTRARQTSEELVGANERGLDCPVENWGW